MPGVNRRVPGDCRWGTPGEVSEAARLFMGGIDLDPASSEAFNSIIRADCFYSEADDSLRKVVPWVGKVFLNPPGGLRSKARQFWNRLVQEHSAGNVTEALYVSFALDSFQWSQGDKCDVPILLFPTYVFASRLRFLHHETLEPQKSPWKPCALTWLPPVETERKATDLAAILDALGLPGVLIGPTA